MSTKKYHFATPSVKIGVLDIQGSVEEHIASLKKLGVEATSVKTASDLKLIDGLIIPGGESTTIGKLMKIYGLDKEITTRARAQLHPLCIWGTCAGAILIAKKVYNHRPNQGEVQSSGGCCPDHLSLMDIEIERNAYGRQTDSFETALSVPVLGKPDVPAVFIRAPMVKRSSRDVKILAEYNGTPVMLEQNNLMVTMFHPELTSDTRIHNYFIDLTSRYAN